MQYRYAIEKNRTVNLKNNNKKTLVQIHDMILLYNSTITVYHNSVY